MTDRLRHPHVPKVLDVGVETGPDGRDIGYLALELLKGEALTQRARWTGRCRGPARCGSPPPPPTCSPWHTGAASCTVT